MIVEIAYANPHEQVILTLRVEPGTRLEEAIKGCGILQRFPQIDLNNAKVGIFGKLASLDTTLQPGDRVEIYRPLIADPKEVRRERAVRPKSSP